MAPPWEVLYDSSAAFATTCHAEPGIAHAVIFVELEGWRCAEPTYDDASSQGAFRRGAGD